MKSIFDENMEEGSIPGSFFISRDKIKIRRGESATLTVTFMPFKLENDKAFIIFQD
jgi:hypothetical protein